VHGNYLTVNHYDKVLEEQWKALPNYIEGENNVLVMQILQEVCKVDQ